MVAVPLLLHVILGVPKHCTPVAHPRTRCRFVFPLVIAVIGSSCRSSLTGQWFVESGIVTSVQLVHDHFPHRMASAGAVLRVTVALVRHPEEQCVGPDGHAAQRSGDGGVVHEKLVLHHLELFVAAHSQVRGTDTDDRSVGNVGEPVVERQIELLVSI